MADRSSASTTELEIRDRAIVERVVAGLSLRAVGAEYGLSDKAVGRIAARAGVHFSHPGRRSWPAHRLAELRQLRSEGLSMGEIAQRLGVSKTTVCRLTLSIACRCWHPSRGRSATAAKATTRPATVPSRLGSQPAPRTATPAPSSASPPSGSAK